MHGCCLLGIPVGYSICMSLKIIKLYYFKQRAVTGDVTKAQGTKHCLMSRD